MSSAAVVFRPRSPQIICTRRQLNDWPAACTSCALPALGIVAGERKMGRDSIGQYVALNIGQPMAINGHVVGNVPP